MNKFFAAALMSATLLGAPAQALVITSGTGSIQATDGVQDGRLYRNGVASTWASPKAYPSQTDTGSNFQFDTVGIAFAANAMQDVYYRISFEPESSDVHSTAYSNSYNPLAQATNYLGDIGSSSTGSYEVKVLAGSSLMLLFNNNTSSSFSGTNYLYRVEAFSDANGGEVFGAVPEPSTWAMMLGGLALIGGQMRRRRTAVSFA
jgi:hypothetical protein